MNRPVRAAAQQANRLLFDEDIEVEGKQLRVLYVVMLTCTYYGDIFIC